MTDRRVTPFSGRVALRGTDIADAPHTDGTAARICAPLADLRRTPDGARDRQLLRGALVCVIDEQGDHAFIQAQADGYCGWVQMGALGPDQPPDRPITHRVTALATHLYQRPDLKSPDMQRLSLNSLLSLGAQSGAFLQDDTGLWVPAAHVQPVDCPASDPISVARKFIGVPYLWGGNSCWGIDCSGLVQAALLACGIPCPGDSDLQLAALGQDIGQALRPAAPFEPGDLLFWKGHVAWVSEPDRILHATAFGMAVIEEPLPQACARIEGQAPRTGHLRLSHRQRQTRLFS